MSDDPILGYPNESLTLKYPNSKWHTLYFQSLGDAVSLDEAIRMTNGKPLNMAEDPWREAQRDIKALRSLDFVDDDDLKQS